MPFLLPVSISFLIDVSAIVTFFGDPSLFGDEGEDISVPDAINPVRSSLLFILLAGVRVLLFLPFVWRYRKDDLLTLSQRPYLWHSFNVLVLLFKAFSEVVSSIVDDSHDQNLFVWLLIAGSLLSVYFQSVALKQLVSTALPERHVVLGISLPNGGTESDRIDVKQPRPERSNVAVNDGGSSVISSGNVGKRASDRLLANRVASYYTSSIEDNRNNVPRNSFDASITPEFLQRFRDQLDVAHDEWNCKIAKLKESIANFGKDNNSAVSQPDAVVFEELLMMFATNSNNRNAIVSGDASRTSRRPAATGGPDDLRTVLNPSPAPGGGDDIRTRDTILRLFERHPKTLEFYIPQLIVYLLYGYAPTSAELRQALLLICEKSVVIAHRIFYFIQAYCMSGAGINPEGVVVLKQLLRNIESAGLSPADVVAAGQGKGETKNKSSEERADSNHGAGSQQIVFSEDLEAPPPNKERTAKSRGCLYPLELSCPPPPGLNNFNITTHFWDELSALSRDLVRFSKEERNSELRQRIPEIEKRLLPSSCIYAPVSNVHHRIWSIVTDECFAFSTKTRAPMFVCLEVVDYHSAATARRVSKLQNRRESFADSLVSGLKRVLNDVSETIHLGSSANTAKEQHGDSRIEAVLLYDSSDRNEDDDKVVSSAPDASLNPLHRSEPEQLTGMNTAGLKNEVGQWSELSQSFTTNSRFEDESVVEFKQREVNSRDSLDLSVVPKSELLADQPLVVFKERWRDKERRMRAKSRVGHLPGYRLLPVIVKTNDDLRQEQIAAQLLFLMNQILIEGEVECWLRPYGIIAMSPDSGLIEAIPDTVSMDVLRRRVPNYTTLRNFFENFFGEGTPEFTTARENFVLSLAPYCIVCYILKLKDRHNGNILLDRKGHVMHIDFGFIFGISPGGNIGFESAPFKLTGEFVDLMGGPRSPLFRRFREICVKTYMELRKHHYQIALLLEMISVGNEHLPCFAGDPAGIIDAMRQRFRPNIHDEAAVDYVHELINRSIDNWTTSCYDKYQKHFVGVF